MAVLKVAVKEIKMVGKMGILKVVKRVQLKVDLKEKFEVAVKDLK